MDKEPVFITAIKYGTIWIAAWGLLNNIHITITHKTKSGEAPRIEVYSHGTLDVHTEGKQDVHVSGYLY